MRTTLKTIPEMTSLELFKILKLRVNVFVVEQTCPYPEIDAIDEGAYHLTFWENQEPIALARIYQQEGFVRIGRVLVNTPHRGQGLGKKLMEAAMEVCLKFYPQLPIKISAQAHLLPFYESLGFQAISAVYLEDQIPHQEMIRRV